MPRVRGVDVTFRSGPGRRKKRKLSKKADCVTGEKQSGDYYSFTPLGESLGGALGSPKRSSPPTQATPLAKRPEVSKSVTFAFEPKVVSPFLEKELKLPLPAKNDGLIPTKDSYRTPSEKAKHTISIVQLSKLSSISDIYIQSDHSCTFTATLAETTADDVPPVHLCTLETILDRRVEAGDGPLPEAFVAFIMSQILQLAARHDDWIVVPSPSSYHDGKLTDDYGLHNYVMQNEAEVFHLKYSSEAMLIQKDESSSCAFIVNAASILLLLLLGIEKEETKTMNTYSNESLQQQLKLKLSYCRDIIMKNRYVRQKEMWRNMFSALSCGSLDEAAKALPLSYLDILPQSNFFLDGCNTPTFESQSHLSEPEITKSFDVGSEAKSVDAGQVKEENWASDERYELSFEQNDLEASQCKDIKSLPGEIYFGEKIEDDTNARNIPTQNASCRSSNHAQLAPKKGIQIYKYGRVIIELSDDSDLEEDGSIM